MLYSTPGTGTIRSWSNCSVRCRSTPWTSGRRRPSISELFTHIHYVRLVFVAENAPEFFGKLPEKECTAEHDPGLIAQMLANSSAAVREAVRGRLETGRPMELHYDHPILMLQHMIWHEGYHHGQIKLTLKLAGIPLSNKEAGPLTWRVWMNKKAALTE